MLIEQVPHIARLPNGKINRRSLSQAVSASKVESQISGSLS